jgi:Transferase family
MTSGSTLTLSDYDQSLGVGTPALYRMFCLREMPNVDRLVFSLGKTLERFPRYATRIVLTDNGRSKLVPLEEPLALELRPAANWAPETFRIEDVPQFVQALTTEAEKPVLAVTLTPVTNGAVLGVSFSHAVGDMYSYYLFHAYWNEQMRLAVGADTGRGQRYARLATASGSSPQRWEENSLEGEDRAKNTKYYYDVISFGQDELEALRAELEKDGTFPSLNEALTAYIVHRFGCKLMGRTSGLRLRVPVDVRGTHPLLPEDYIGNAIIEVLVPLGELADTPAAARATAHRIRETVRAARRPQNIESTIAVDEGGIKLLGKDLPVYDRHTDIISTNLSKMHFHKLDFGGGPPVRVFGMAYNGLCIAATENGLEARTKWIRGPHFF